MAAWLGDTLAAGAAAAAGIARIENGGPLCFRRQTESVRSLTRCIGAAERLFVVGRLVVAAAELARTGFDQSTEKPAVQGSGRLVYTADHNACLM